MTIDSTASHMDSDPRTATRSRSALHRALRKPRAVVSLIILGGFMLIAVFGVWIAPYNPRVKSGSLFAPPSAEHLLGTDGGGVDVLSMTIVGCRASITVGLAAAVLSTIIGGIVGISAGYFGGRTDTVLMRISDCVLVLPDIPLMMIAAALFGRSLKNIIIIIGIIYWAWNARIIRSQVKSIRERLYIKRTRSLGASNLRIILRHLLPQVAPLLVATTVLYIAFAIFAQAFIAFLGLGDPNLISWGSQIQSAFAEDAVLNGAWWVILPPGVSIAAVVLVVSIIGQSIEEAMNPRLNSPHLSVVPFRVLPRRGIDGPSI